VKIKEVVAMLNEFAKVAGEDCEVQIAELRMIGTISEDYTDRSFRSYGDPRKTKPSYYVVATEYARPPLFKEIPEEIS
jgi:hypothetical protein